MKVMASLCICQTLVAILMFAQSTEVTNPATKNGISANLALISACKTSEAVSILQKMMESCLFILYQALNIRVMQIEFFKVTKSSLSGPAKTLCFDEKLQGAFGAQ
jgi:hypothetical protein